MRRGDVVLAGDGGLEPTYLLDAEAQLLPGARPLRTGARVHVHHGTRDTPARAVPLDGVGPAAGTARPGAAAARAAAGAGAGDRFVLRQIAPPDTLGGGTVVDPQPRKHGGSEAHVARLRAIAGGDPLESLRLELERSPSGVGPEAGTDLLAQLVEDGAAAPAGRARRHWFTPAALDDARRRVQDALDRGGAGRGALARMAALDAPAVAAVLEDLVAEGAVTERDGVFAATTGAPRALDDPLAAVLAEVVRAGGTAPPAPDALAREGGVERAAAIAALEALARDGTLVRLRPGIYFDPDALAAARAAAVARLRGPGRGHDRRAARCAGDQPQARPGHPRAPRRRKGHASPRRRARAQAGADLVASGGPMRMRQSMAQLEREFEEQAVLERHQREQLRRSAIKRTRTRRRAKIERGQQLRFFMLIASIALTVVVVTVVMFETLAWLMG